MRALLARLGVTLTAAIGCLAAAPAAGAAGPAAVADRLDPAHTGSTTDPALVPPLRPRWVRLLDREDAYQPRISYPLVAGGRVFTVVVPADTGVAVLYALSAQTGATLWSRTLTGAGAAWPAYDGGRVFVATYGDVRAFDAETGELLWTRTGVGGDAPVAAGGVVYTHMSWQAQALRAQDGSTLWSRDLFSASYVTLGDQHAYYHGSKHTYALRRSDGAVTWEYWPGYDGFEGISMAPLALHGGRLWFTDTVDATVLDAASGLKAGTRDSTRPPAFGGGNAFVMWGSNPVDPAVRVLQARDESTDALRWEFAAERGILTAPTVVTGMVYVAGYHRALYALGAGDGRLRWCTTMPYHADTGADIVAGEGLLVVAAGPGIVAYEPGGVAGCDYNRVSRPGWYGPAPEATRTAPAAAVAPPVAAAAPEPAVFRIALSRRRGTRVVARVRGRRLAGRRLVIYAEPRAADDRRPRASDGRLRRVAGGRLRRVAPRRFVARVTVRRRGPLRACVRRPGGRCGRRAMRASSRELWPR